MATTKADLAFDEFMKIDMDQMNIDDLDEFEGMIEKRIFFFRILAIESKKDKEDEMRSDMQEEKPEVIED